MPSTSSTSPVKAKPAIKQGDHVIVPAQGLYTITNTEVTKITGMDDVSMFVLTPFGKPDSTDVIRFPQASIARKVETLPDADDIKAVEKMLSRRFAQGPGGGGAAMRIYGLINSWGFANMAEGVAKLRPSIKVYPHTSIHSAGAIATGIERLALVIHAATGEDHAACITRLTQLADAEPLQAPPPARGLPAGSRATAIAAGKSVAKTDATPV